MLSMAFMTSAMAVNPVISDVERLKDVCWFHLMTGYMPQGQYGYEGALYLTYWNLGTTTQYIMLTAEGAERVFIYWPESKAEEIDPEARIFWADPVTPGMIDVWYVGWSAGAQITVKLELISPTYMLLYDGPMTIPHP